MPGPDIVGRRIDVPTGDLNLEQWQEIVDLNLTSTFICTKLIGGAMVRRGQGAEVAAASGLVATGSIGGRSYETSEAAVIQFTRAVAADWAPHRVTVSAIAPGVFLTEPNLRWSRLNPAVMETFRVQIPMGEFGRPEDLGPLAAYLASDAFRYMTRAILVLNGGVRSGVCGDSHGWAPPEGQSAVGNGAGRKGSRRAALGHDSARPRRRLLGGTEALGASVETPSGGSVGA
jgi:NAD(P)-dependent dehydrogenase (short-subunit alcohol dehydrogenase family)